MLILLRIVFNSGIYKSIGKSFAEERRQFETIYFEKSCSENGRNVRHGCLRNLPRSSFLALLIS